MWDGIDTIDGWLIYIFLNVFAENFWREFQFVMQCRGSNRPSDTPIILKFMNVNTRQERDGPHI